MQSAPACQVWNMFQPPWLGGTLEARRVPVVPQSVATKSTLKPICFKRSAVMSPCALVIPWSWATMQTTGSPL